VSSSELVHNRRTVLARRMLVYLAALLGLALVAAAIAPQPAPAPLPQSPAAGAPGTIASRTLAPVMDPGDRVVVRVGDVVTLTVPSATPDTVEIAGLGLSAFGDPALPAQIELVAYPAGTYPVTRLSTGARVGMLVIQPARTAPALSRPQLRPTAPSRSAAPVA
jgi:hypothetical protein